MLASHEQRDRVAARLESHDANVTDRVENEERTADSEARS